MEEVKLYWYIRIHICKMYTYLIQYNLGYYNLTKHVIYSNASLI